ncbi:MAG: hypothetical protein ABEJ82_00010 [Haloplanus sp.]
MSPDADGSDDPTDVRAVAVTTEDVVAALETNRRTSRRTVLRVTPPFSGRMRARLHRPDGDEGAAIRLDPERLVEEVPAYPDPDETADELRAADAYDPETHRERHVEAVRAWRESVREAVVDAVDVATPDGPHRIEVSWLG